MCDGPQINRIIQSAVRFQQTPADPEAIRVLRENLPQAFQCSHWDNLPKNTYATINLDVFKADEGIRTFRTTLKEKGVIGPRLLIDAIDTDWNMDNGIEAIRVTIIDEEGKESLFPLAATPENSAKIFSGVNEVIRDFITEARELNETFDRMGEPPGYVPVEWIE